MSDVAVLALINEVRGRHPRLWVGLHLLGCSAEETLRRGLAACVGRLDGIRSDDGRIDENAASQPAAQAFVAAPMTALTLALLVSRESRASTAEPVVLTLVAPPSGATVPTDTLIWLDNTHASLVAGATEFVLLGPDDERIALTDASTISTSIGDVMLSKPVRLLQPDSTYSLWQCNIDECLHMVTRFRTGAGPTTSPPPVPQATELYESNGYMETDVEFDGLLVVAREPDDLDAAARTGDVVGMGVPGERVQVSLHYKVNKIHIGVFDYAGNFSGFTDTLPLGRGQHHYCNCDGGAADPPDPPGALLLLLACTRRRRRHAA